VQIDTESEVSDDWPPVSALGSGAQRAAAMAALEVFLLPEWCGAKGSGTILIIEEPEAGLHPSALRRVTTQLRRLPDSGVQVIVTTHSPAVINAVSSDDIRTLRPERAEDGLWRRVVRTPSGLDEVRETIGVLPSDILLGDRFLIVEGPNDVAAYRAWMRAIGADPDREGIRVIAAGGASGVAALSSLMDHAYEGARFWALYDGDQRDTLARRAATRLADRVTVRVLDRWMLECYLHPDAIARYLDAEAERAGRELDEQRLLRLSELGPRLAVSRQPKSDLCAIFYEALDREYQDSEVSAIAAVMHYQELPGELVGLLTEICA
jgi:hypothetical protein